MKSQTQKEMPKYNAKKVIWAHKIHGFIYDSDKQICAFVPSEPGYDNVEISRAYVGKHNPHIGGYYLRHEDGHNSFAPADKFEACNTLIKDTFLIKTSADKEDTKESSYIRVTNAEADNVILKDTVRIYTKIVKDYKRIAHGKSIDTSLADRILKLEQENASLKTSRDSMALELRVCVKAIIAARKNLGC